MNNRHTDILLRHRDLGALRAVDALLAPLLAGPARRPLAIAANAAQIGRRGNFDAGMGARYKW